jgi:hypothetical protein
MEDNERAVSEGVLADPPFSELMSRWLEEGDRLSENVAATATGPSSPTDGSLRLRLLRLRAVVDRYRLFVLAGVGLLPLVLFMAIQRGAPASAVAASMVSVTPLPANPAPAPAQAVSARPVESVEPSARRSEKRPRRPRSASRHSVSRQSR